jgi:3-dehydroquinate synthase
MHRLTVELGKRSYPIYIGQNLLGQAELVAPLVLGRQVMIVSNETVAPLYLATAQAAFADFQTTSVILPDGERYKTLEVLNQILISYYNSVLIGVAL